MSLLVVLNKLNGHIDGHSWCTDCQMANTRVQRQQMHERKDKLHIDGNKKGTIWICGRRRRPELDLKQHKVRKAK